MTRWLCLAFLCTGAASHAAPIAHRPTVIAAERDFAAVRYFLVSSMELDQYGECSPAAPLRWLLARAGAPLSDPAQAATP